MSEKGYEEQLEDLESEDPSIRSRLRAAGLDLDQIDAEGFGRLYEQRWNQIEAMLDAVPADSDSSLPVGG